MGEEQKLEADYIKVVPGGIVRCMKIQMTSVEVFVGKSDFGEEGGGLLPH